MIEVLAGPELADGSGDALVVPVYADLTWGPGAEWASGALGDWVPSYLEARDCGGKNKRVAVLDAVGAALATDGGSSAVAM